MDQRSLKHSSNALRVVENRLLSIVLSPSPPYVGGMRCTHCQLCCHETMMELSEADMARLELRGHARNDFIVLGHDRIPRLRNVGGWCVFYDPEARRCREYRYRPLGCVLYPVNLDENDDVIVDALCPQAGTMPRSEIADSGRRLRSLLNTIDREADRR